VCAIDAMQENALDYRDWVLQATHANASKDIVRKVTSSSHRELSQILCSHSHVEAFPEMSL